MPVQQPTAHHGVSSSLKFSTFDRALQEYIDKLPKDKHSKQLKFIELCRDTTGVTPQSINDLIQQEEAKHNISGPVRRLFKRITSALADYSAVIGQLVSAQPLPLAIIWGALKVVVESAARCRNMFEVMKDELQALADQIQRITDYEDLYGDSDAMQRYFFCSYTNMIRFWHRVHKECHRSSISTVGQSLTSASTKKLFGIVNDLKRDVEAIAQEASVCQAKLDNIEYTDAQKERAAASKERDIQSAWREKQSAQNYLELCGMIRQFLTPWQAESANSSRHFLNLQNQHPGTCNWLAEDAVFQAWTDTECPVHPILSLSGPLGCGKSVLSSFAIRHVESRAAVAFYFCQFFQPCDSVHELLRLLALQLFNAYFARKLPVDSDLCHQVLCSTTPDQIQTLIRELVMNLTPAYFFFDGLDEAQGPSQTHVAVVLDVLIRLCDEFPGRLRLWCTRRRQMRAVDCYHTCVRPRPHFALEISNHTAADVVRFIQSKFETIRDRFGAAAADGLSEQDQELVAVAENYLVSRAQGNFLWAKLMVQDFDGEDRIEDVFELLRRVVGNQPKELSGIYKSKFCRIKPDDRKVAAKVIAIIAFARRQLCVKEIRDALLQVTTRGKKSASDSDLLKLSITTFLSKYTALIEVDQETSEPGPDSFCRLAHSSVLEFLLENRTVLGEERALQITSYTIADACLVYLARPIYSQLLQKHVQDDGSPMWVDSTDRPMNDHYFAQYSAKYWSRHLEEVEPEKALQTRVASFVESTNFETCIQMQMLWVQGKFDLYSVCGRLCLLRIFPSWFIRPPNPGRKWSAVSKHWENYRTLLHDWRGLLSCGGCHDREVECKHVDHRGEIDRLWWAALGPDHIFSHFHSRYTSFRLIDKAQHTTKFDKDERYEALCWKKQCFTTLRLSQWNWTTHKLIFVCQHWSRGDSSVVPSLEMTQVIETNEAVTNWRLYTKHSVEDSFNLVARPTMFSEDGGLLRIGAQVFSLTDDGRYQPLFLGEPGSSFPSYFEEFSRRDGFISIASRAHTAAEELQMQYRELEGIGADLSRLESFAYSQTGQPVGEDSDDEGEDDEERAFNALSDSESDNDADDEGYESWSEGSTDYGDNDNRIESELDDVLSDESASNTESEQEVEDDIQSTHASEVGHPAGNDEDANSDSSEDPPPLPPSAFIDHIARNSDDEDVLDGSKLTGGLLGDFQHGRPTLSWRNAQQSKNEPQMMLSIFDNSIKSPAKRIFQFSHPLPFMLYASPPAFHPHQPLLAWPLGAGDVLFVDFVAKTYFMRKIRSSAPRTRAVAVKLHFSACGRYLHVASLEAQTNSNIQKRKVKSFEKHSPADSQDLPELQLNLLLLTCRLSLHKTTRCPPVLVHRVKISVGTCKKLSVSRLPITFTWTEQDLYVTHSTPHLRVLRLALFHDANDSVQGHNVLVPRNRTFLPDTAAKRDVYFLPGSNGEETPGSGSRPAVVVVGAETRAGDIALIDKPFEVGFTTAAEVADSVSDGVGARGFLAPPVGCFLTEEDLGGWMRADEEVPVQKGRGVGKFDPRKEKFDPVEDCDVEPYLKFV
ncbi:hypothetical protein BKA62DRAFT_504918 [Auriculariales sp. MPI-PUGE-AT-0066]|nr:hypothetical protein BKA62DRAFT_504918 [Auriculariales sp. MPI-PUGE-AT-0066]